MYTHITTLPLVFLLCVDCTGGKEWQECGTACPLTCDNHDQFQICTLQCVQGCFCPAGTVEHNGTCVTTDQCPESTRKSFSCMGVLQLERKIVWKGFTARSKFGPHIHVAFYHLFTTVQKVLILKLSCWSIPNFHCVWA